MEGYTSDQQQQQPQQQEDHQTELLAGTENPASPCSATYGQLYQQQAINGYPYGNCQNYYSHYNSAVPQFVAPQYASYVSPVGQQVRYFPPVVKKSKSKKKAFGCC